MVFFDIDATLIDHDRAAAIASLAFHNRFASILPHAAEDFPKTWETAQDRHFTRFCEGELSLVEQRRERLRDIFNDPNLGGDEADSRYDVFVQAYEANWSAFDDVAPCLAKLGDERLGIISNGGLEQQRNKLQAAGLLERFSVIVISEEVGRGKPNPEIFLEACRRAELAPEECTYVGDSWQNDVLGCRALGMTPVWLNRRGLAPLDPTVKSIRTLENFVLRDRQRTM